ncbi:DUF21 domain-containing protein [candidate division KSB1 bacterium]|nr:DUF21 domain-containing protein [candidate division KSB1 bacterium]
MEPDPASFIFSFIFLLVCSAFFSGSETAFFSLSPLSLEKMTEKNDKRSRRIVAMLERPRRLLIAILIGNTLVNVAAASLAAIFVSQLSVQWGIPQNIALIFNVVFVTFIILVISEITPKILAVKNPQRFAKTVVPLVFIIYLLFLPFSILLDRTLYKMISLFKIRESETEHYLEKSELQVLLQLGEDQGELESEEKEMIHSIIEFGDTIVREIMVPRTDMVCVAEDITINDLIELIKVKGHTRIPIFQDNIDRIKGIINAKDLLASVLEHQEKPNLLELARPAIFVPESKKIDDLLRVFQKERQHMAIVVDEYGGTSGLVTLEDVLEEIVGEIRDEYDQEVALYKRLDENSWIVAAKIDIHSLNELINIQIPEKDEYDTLGGFIFDLTGSVPEENQVISYRGYDLVTVKVEQNRIINVKIIQQIHSEPVNE